MSINFSNPTATQIEQMGVAERLYQAAFGHIGDMQGVEFWANSLDSGTVTPLDVARDFTNSSEFEHQYAGTSNAQFVVSLYHNVLGRDPDTDGFDHWLTLLNTDGADRAQVLLGFAQSGEFIQTSSAGIHQVLSDLEHNIADSATMPLPGVPTYHPPMLMPDQGAAVAALEVSQVLHGAIQPNAQVLSSNELSYKAALDLSGGDARNAYKLLAVEMGAGPNLLSGLSANDAITAAFKAAHNGVGPTATELAHFTGDLALEQSIYGTQQGIYAEVGNVIYEADHAGTGDLSILAHVAATADHLRGSHALDDQQLDVMTVTNTITVEHDVPVPYEVDVQMPEPHTVTHVVGGSVDALGENPAHPGTLLTGSGIPNTGIYSAHDATTNLDIFFQAGYRTSAEQFHFDGVEPDGTVHVSGAAGLQDGTHGEQGASATRDHLALTFGAIGGPGAFQSNQIDLYLDKDPGAGTNFSHLTLEVLGGQQVWVDANTGTPVIGDDPQNYPNSVAENTTNMSFSQWGAPATPGQYDVILTETPLVGVNAGHAVMSEHMVITLA